VKFASYLKDGKPSYGMVLDEGIADIGMARQERYPTLKDLIGTGDTLSFLFGQNARPNLAFEQVQFLPVIPNSDAIFCVGLNYADHARETGRPLPEYPSTFLKLNRSLVGHREQLLRPKVSVAFDWEAELAVVIGRAARHVKEADALSYVAGYTCLNDATLRDWQHTQGVTLGKNFFRSGACGPWLVTPDEIPDPAALTVRSRLNGVEMQRASTSNLVFSVPHLISHYSSLTELFPGDIISTGTPGGVGHRRKPPLYMSSGDVIEVEISGIGTLRNFIIDEMPGAPKEPQNHGVIA
jgi:2-keto-4-pentenoate hydratase/2-oxohepta-3-ene-1,7-dioic acid hydratase in catechol pathway